MNKKINSLTYLIPYVVLLREILLHKGVIHRFYTTTLEDVNASIGFTSFLIFLISFAQYYTYIHYNKKCLWNIKLFLSALAKLYYLLSFEYFILYNFDIYVNPHLYALSMLGLTFIGFDIYLNKDELCDK